MKLFLVYPLAALFEIAGCFAFWAWWRLEKSPLWLLPGMVSLALFAWLLTLVPTDAAGRAFAAYGGVYVAASLLWLWIVEGTPAVSTIHSYHTLPLPSSTQRQMCTTTLSPAEHAEGQRRGKNSGNQENIPSEKLRWSAAKKAIQN